MKTSRRKLASLLTLSAMMLAVLAPQAAAVADTPDEPVSGDTDIDDPTPPEDDNGVGSQTPPQEGDVAPADQSPSQEDAQPSSEDGNQASSENDDQALPQGDDVEVSDDDITDEPRDTDQANTDPPLCLDVYDVSKVKRFVSFDTTPNAGTLTSTATFTLNAKPLTDCILEVAFSSYSLPYGNRDPLQDQQHFHSPEVLRFDTTDVAAGASIGSLQVNLPQCGFQTDAYITNSAWTNRYGMTFERGRAMSLSSNGHAPLWLGVADRYGIWPNNSLRVPTGFPDDGYDCSQVPTDPETEPETEPEPQSLPTPQPAPEPEDDEIVVADLATVAPAASLASVCLDTDDLSVTYTLDNTGSTGDVAYTVSIGDDSEVVTVDAEASVSDTFTLSPDDGAVLVTINADGVVAPLVSQPFDATDCVADVLGELEEAPADDPAEVLEEREEAPADDTAEVLDEREELTTQEVADTEDVADTDELARTGSSTTLLTLIGALLALFGVALLRRRTGDVS